MRRWWENSSYWSGSSITERWGMLSRSMEGDLTISNTETFIQGLIKQIFWNPEKNHKVLNVCFIKWCSAISNILDITIRNWQKMIIDREIDLLGETECDRSDLMLHTHTTAESTPFNFTKTPRALNRLFCPLLTFCNTCQLQIHF